MVLCRNNKAEGVFDLAIALLCVEWGIQPNSLAVSEILLLIFEQEEDLHVIRIIAFFLEKYGTADEVSKIAHIAETSKSLIKKQIAIKTLGIIKKRRATHQLLNHLNHKTPINKGSEATTLENTGSETAVQPLIECLKDKDLVIRGSALSALGKISLRTPISNIDRLIEALVKLKRNKIYLSVIILRNLLDSAFRTGDLDMIEKSIEHAKRGVGNGEDVFKPYIVALQYLKADQDPAIIERQQPEMREAIQLLVDSIC